MHLVLFGCRIRHFCPYAAAINRARGGRGHGTPLPGVQGALSTIEMEANRIHLVRFGCRTQHSVPVWQPSTGQERQGANWWPKQQRQRRKAAPTCE
jgi:hypothetical protein